MISYLRLIEKLHGLEDEFIRRHLIDRRGVKLLEAIALKHADNQSLMTTDVMKLSEFGSPAAIHRSLRRLRDASLVLDFYRGKDRRAKYLCVSSKTHEYYSELGFVFIAFGGKE